MVTNHLDDEPGGNVEHVEEHDLTTDDVDFVIAHFVSSTVSRPSGRRCMFGYTPGDRYIVVIYEEVGDVIIPITAYEAPEP